jgi:hypothetical protein
MWSKMLVLLLDSLGGMLETIHLFFKAGISVHL